jgi:hypothetical protein
VVQQPTIVPENSGTTQPAPQPPVVQQTQQQQHAPIFVQIVQPAQNPAQVNAQSENSQQANEYKITNDNSAHAAVQTPTVNVGSAGEQKYTYVNAPNKNTGLASADEIRSLLQQGLFVGGAPQVEESVSASSSANASENAHAQKALSDLGNGKNFTVNSHAPSTIPAFTATSSQASVVVSSTNVVPVGTPVNSNEPWSLIVHALQGTWSGVGQSTSALEQKIASVTQAQSNYESVRAQVQDLQEAQHAGICDDTCKKSLDTLSYQLPLQRAAVNALNRSIDDEITAGSKDAFGASMPIVELEQSLIPPPPPPPAFKISFDGTLSLVDQLPSGVFSAPSAATVTEEETPRAENSSGDVTPSPTSVAPPVDPFAKPIYVLRDPNMFTAPASSPVFVGNPGNSFHAISQSDSLTSLVSNVVSWLGDSLTVATTQDSQHCSLFRSLFEQCN